MFQPRGYRKAKQEDTDESSDGKKSLGEGGGDYGKEMKKIEKSGVAYLSVEPVGAKDGVDATDEDIDDCPKMLWCPTCERRVVSEVELESTWRTFLIIFMLFLLLGWIAFCVTPFVWTLIQTAGHYCPHCGERICSKQRVRFPVIKNEVVTMKIGNCAVVLSRRYVIGLCFMTGTILLVYLARWYVINVGIGEVPKGPEIDATWNEFLDDCGARTTLGNPIRAVDLFSKKYQGKTVNWKGTLNRISEGIFSKNFILIDMHPSQYQARSMADIALILKPEFLDVAKQLEAGDWVAFQTTLLDMGRRGKPHYGILWQLEKTQAERLPMTLPGIFSLFEPLGMISHLLMNSSPMDDSNNSTESRNRRVVIVSQPRIQGDEIHGGRNNNSMLGGNIIESIRDHTASDDNDHDHDHGEDVSEHSSNHEADISPGRSKEENNNIEEIIKDGKDKEKQDNLNEKKNS